MSETIQHGFCHCGCGERTNPCRQSDTKRGLVKGEPRRFVVGHQRRGVISHNRKTGPLYLEEDRGFGSPCWIWQQAIVTNGYGRVYRNGRLQQAHRFFYEEANGPIPDGLVIDHLCRVRCCVNPAHLEAVTNGENLRRGVNKRLSDQQVAEIAHLIAEGWQSTDVAAAYGISQSYASKIGRGERDIEIRLLKAEIDRLRAENERLRAGGG